MSRDKTRESLALVGAVGGRKWGRANIHSAARPQTSGMTALTPVTPSNRPARPGTAEAKASKEQIKRGREVGSENRSHLEMHGLFVSGC